MRIFIDMDNVLVDFGSGIEQLSSETRNEYENRLDEVPGIFALMRPLPGGVESYKRLAATHDVFILSTAPWENPSAWSDKLAWVKEHLGTVAKKRLILTHHKYLVRGDILIDDRRKRGAGAFSGRHIHFGPDGEFPDWPAVMKEIEEIS
jgi:5'(3')-deoxyribonucleotidase